MRRRASRRDIRPFIDTYGLDPSEFLSSRRSSNRSNDFFIRRLKPSARPIDPAPDSVVFPADGRHLGFADVSRVEAIVVKGQSFDLPALLGDAALAERHRGGAVVISRLCPTDYTGSTSPPQAFPQRRACCRAPLLREPDRAAAPDRDPVREQARAGPARERSLRPRHDRRDRGDVRGSIVSTFKPHENVAKGAEKGYFSSAGRR